MSTSQVGQLRANTMCGTLCVKICVHPPFFPTRGNQFCATSVVSGGGGGGRRSNGYLQREEKLVPLEEPPASVLVDGASVVLVDDVTAFSDTVLLPRPAALDGRVEKVHVRIERKLETANAIMGTTA